MTEPLLRVEALTKTFHVDQGGLFGRRAPLTAVNDVSFDLYEGQTLGVVGESGCGKSTLGRTILRLIHPDGGRVLWKGEDLERADMRFHRRNMQIIFQDPIASLDPRMTVGDIIAEPLTAFETALNRRQRRGRVLEIMEAVGLKPEMINRYPHEFSGGQAQRIGVARAVICKPKLIVCDEPVSALDVSIQAQIIALLRDLKEQFGLTLVFISHDLSIVRLISDQVMVMYLGRAVETGPADAVFSAPAHPYTKALLAAAPVPNPAAMAGRASVALAGDPPSPLAPPSGCPFRTRCPQAEAICAKTFPEPQTIGPGRQAWCAQLGDTTV